MKAALLVAALLLAGCTQPASKVESSGCENVPDIALAGRVTDAAQILADTDKSKLDAQLRTYEQKSGHQMVIATVPTLGGVDVATFGTCLGNRWDIGHADSDDGVVILVAPNDRRLRVATGFGMAKLLSDADAQVAVDRMIPFFKQGDYAGGLLSGVDAISAKTGGNQ